MLLAFAVDNLYSFFVCLCGTFVVAIGNDFVSLWLTMKKKIHFNRPLVAAQSALSLHNWRNCRRTKVWSFITMECRWTVYINQRRRKRVFVCCFWCSSRSHWGWRLHTKQKGNWLFVWQVTWNTISVHHPCACVCVCAGGFSIESLWNCATVRVHTSWILIDMIWGTRYPCSSVGSHWFIDQVVWYERKFLGENR